MASAWDFADNQLQAALTAWKNTFTGDLSRLKLYQNDYVPVPGTVLGDFVEADFPGYVDAPFSPNEFGSVVVVDHVAISTFPTALEFEADNTPFTPQVIYGYYVVDLDDNYAWSVRFDEPRTIFPGTELKITPQLKQRSCAE